MHKAPSPFLRALYIGFENGMRPCVGILRLSYGMIGTAAGLLNQRNSAGGRPQNNFICSRRDAATPSIGASCGAGNIVNAFRQFRRAAIGSRKPIESVAPERGYPRCQLR
jgi:hypothetical protein